jgi:predicted DNA-binding transcriptional regulator YafY
VVELLGTRVPAPPPPDDAITFVTRSLARGRRHQLRLRVHAPADAVRRKVPATVAEVIEDDDTCELRLATDELPGAARWVASLGFDVDVIEPDELRVQLAEFGAYLTERYAR